MRVKFGDRTLVEARANAEPADDLITDDYYAQLQQIRLTRDPTDHRIQSSASAEIILDGTDIGRLVECAIRHPSPQMRNVVLATIWNHPEAFRLIFEFGLNAPEAFQEIRKIVADALANHAAGSEAPAASGDKPLLPRMPLPAHLRDRARKE